MKSLWLLVLGGWLGLAGAPAADRAAVQVRWFGQAFFELSSSTGVRVAIDPFDNSFFNYPLPRGLTADLLLVTHEHKDHNNVGLIGGAPLICRSEQGVGRFERKGVTVTGTAAFHDEQHGAQRGPDTVYSFELDGVRFCHVGDLGCLLTPEQLKSIGRVDVLFLPCGGFFTLEVGKLDRLVEQLNPRVIVPMHFKTPYTPKLPIAPADPYLDAKKNVRRLGTDSFTISKQSLPAHPEIWLLEIK